MKQSRLKIEVASSLTLLAMTLVLPVTTAWAEEAGQMVLTIGRVSDNPKKHYPEIKQFIDYVAKRLNPLGVKEGRVLLTRNNGEMIDLLKKGEVDLVTETPFSSLLYEERAGAKIILRRWKNVSSQYSSVIFVRKDSGIDSLEQLKGKKIAFEDPGSTSGYFLPRATFKQLGFELVPLKSFEDPVPADKIGYLFAGGEINLTHWVHRRLAAAGALSNIEFTDPEEVPEEYLPDFKEIYESILVPRNLILVRNGMDPSLEAAIQQLLIDMKDSEEGRKVMRKFNKTANFDELPGGAEEGLSEVRRLYHLIRDEI